MTGHYSSYKLIAIHMRGHTKSKHLTIRRSKIEPSPTVDDKLMPTDSHHGARDSFSSSSTINYDRSEWTEIEDWNPKPER